MVALGFAIMRDPSPRAVLMAARQLLELTLAGATGGCVFLGSWAQALVRKKLRLQGDLRLAMKLQPFADLLQTQQAKL